MWQMKQIIRSIKKSKNIALFSHTNPDPDTIGSTLSLYLALCSLGKNVEIFCDCDDMLKYEIFDEAIDYKNQIPATNFDLYIAVDVASLSMLGSFETEFQKAKTTGCSTIRIDHHISGENYADINFVENTSACAILVYNLIKKLKAKISEPIATRLYFGICGDTGIFRNNNTDSVTFEVSAKLLKDGANMRYVYQEFFDKKTVPYIKLTSKALLNAEIDENDKFVVLTLSSEDYKKFNASKTESVGNLPNMYLNCGYKISAILREEDDGIRCSLRSKFEYDCSKIAEKFGGGGHKNASGCKIESDLHSAKEQLIKEIKIYLKENQ